MPFEEKLHDDKVKHLFWDTQPVIGSSIVQKNPDMDGPIEPKPKLSETPITFPDNIKLCSVDISSEADVEAVSNLLAQNYVEDSEHNFRLFYSKSFLKWYNMKLAI